MLREVGEHLGDRCVALGIPQLEYREVFDLLREKLATEVVLEEEQRHLEQAAETYVCQPDVLVPRLYPFCSGRVTAMERIDGHKVTERGDQNPVDRRRVGELIVEAMIAGPILSQARRATFHADPHAGNLFVTDDRRLAILDWSLTGTLGECERVAMTQMILGGLSLSAGQIRSGLLDLDHNKQVDVHALEAVIHDWLKRIRGGVLPGFSWLMGMLDDAVLRARLRAKTDLILFRKALLTLDGVLADVSAGVCVDELLASHFLRRLAGEWPRRFLAPPHCRAFQTRLSNEDLTLLLLRLPSTPARAWVENTLEYISQAIG